MWCEWALLWTRYILKAYPGPPNQKKKKRNFEKKYTVQVWRALEKVPNHWAWCEAGEMPMEPIIVRTTLNLRNVLIFGQKWNILYKLLRWFQNFKKTFYYGEPYNTNTIILHITLNITCIILIMTFILWKNSFVNNKYLVTDYWFSTTILVFNTKSFAKRIVWFPYRFCNKEAYSKGDFEFWIFIFIFRLLLFWETGGDVKVTFKVSRNVRLNYIGEKNILSDFFSFSSSFQYKRW